MAGPEPCLPSCAEPSGRMVRPAFRRSLISDRIRETMGHAWATDRCRPMAGVAMDQGGRLLKLCRKPSLHSSERPGIERRPQLVLLSIFPSSALRCTRR